MLLQCIPYHPHAQKIDLDTLADRIQSTDLIPSRASLLLNLEEHIRLLKAQGLRTLEDLRQALKNPKSIQVLCDRTGIAVETLTLLRREIEGYFPKPFPIAALPKMNAGVLARLEEAHLNDSQALYENLGSPERRRAFSADLDIPLQLLDELFALADLSRIQWTSPTFAQMLFDAGYDSPQKVASAAPEVLSAALEKANSGNRHFKGKIGLRDIKRLIKAASYIE